MTTRVLWCFAAERKRNAVPLTTVEGLQHVIDVAAVTSFAGQFYAMVGQVRPVGRVMLSTENPVLR